MLDQAWDPLKAETAASDQAGSSLERNAAAVEEIGDVADSAQERESLDDETHTRCVQVGLSLMAVLFLPTRQASLRVPSCLYLQYTRRPLSAGKR